MSSIISNQGVQAQVSGRWFSIKRVSETQYKIVDRSSGSDADKIVKITGINF